MKTDFQKHSLLHSHNAADIYKASPYGAGDSGDIAGLKCCVLTLASSCSVVEPRGFWFHAQTGWNNDIYLMGFEQGFSS